MTQTVKPLIRELTSDEIHEFLTRNWIGRIAFSWRDRIDIEPIHFVYDPPWIFGRTSIGAKLLALAHNQWCAFETDDVIDLFDWRSVVVKGPFAAMNSSLGQDVKYDRALNAMRRILPSVFAPDDPVPERNVVWGIHASEITGRCMSSGDPERAAR